MPSVYTYTTDVQDILNAVAQDVRQQLSAVNAPDAGVLIDYTNRVSLQMLRASKWAFLLSAPKSFVTQTGVQNYWVGQASSAPTNALDTGLNLSDVRVVKPNSVIDRSNYRILKAIGTNPLTRSASFPDSESRPGRPSSFQQSWANPQIIYLYPAPDNQNNYYPTPQPPTVTTAISGALSSRTYRVATTFVDSNGHESTPSDPTQIFIQANSVLVVRPPTPPTGSAVGIQYDRYNVYVIPDTVSGEFNHNTSDLRLQASLISSGTSWTEPDSGLIAGVSPPLSTQIEPVDGYVIEFQYYKKRVQLLNTTDILQIPDDYKDIVIAGVCSRALKYLGRPDEAGTAQGEFKSGLTEIIRDTNFYAEGPDYMSPDPTSIRYPGPGVDPNVDPSALLT